MDTEKYEDLILLTTAPSLQEISAFHAAAELFRRNWIVHELTPTRDRLKSLLGDKLALISSIVAKMKLPDTIRDMIMAQIYSIDMKLGCWTWSEENTCYSIDPSDRNGFVYFPHCYDDIIWQHEDFTVDVEQTVRNMLKCDEFNDLQKFKLACSYCIEDHIEQLWPSVTSMWEPNIMSLISNKYVRYWIEKKMIGGIPRNSQDDVSMVQVLSEYNYPAYKHYWNRLQSHHQVQVILHFIRCDITFPFEYILPKLDLLQWIQLVNENPDNVMFHLIRKYSEDDRKTGNILRIWTYVQDMMNDDVFKRMIHMCCEHTCRIDKCCLHRQIWSKAPDHLKEDLLIELFDIRCHALLDSAKVPVFFNTDLRSVQFERKSEYFRKLSASIARCYSSSDFEKLMAWCFTESEIVAFKARLLEDVERSIESEQVDFSGKNRLIDFLSGINRL